MKSINVLMMLMIFLTSHALSAQKNPQPRYHASIQTMNDRIVNGLLIQLEDSAVIIYPGKQKGLRKGVIQDSVKIVYSNIQRMKLKKKHGLSRGLVVGGGIGFAPAFFGEGGAYVALLSFPIGIITGAITGSTSSKKYSINGNYVAFNKMKRKIQ